VTVERLIVVTRDDLPAAAQAVQSVHAALAFAAYHSALAGAWMANSNTLALLSVPDEAALADLVERARFHGLRISLFHEPDLGGALTAIALEPAARRICRALPLALAPPA
jgi:hypothetical protein